MTLPPPSFRRKTLSLARQLEELVRARDGVTAEEACRMLLQASRVPPLLAARFLQELVAGDHRFRFGPDGKVTLGALPAAPSLKLREARFTVLDLETTGGSPSGDRILEIGAVQVAEGRSLGRTFTTLINPGIPIPPFISSMTGILEEMIESAPSFLAIGEELARFIGDSVIVAHNLPFDLGFLNQEFDRNCGFVLANPSLCTVRMGRRLLPHLPDRRLDTLAEYYGFSFAARHRALGDAEVTARLLLKFISLLDERGVEDLEALERFLAGGGKPGNEERVSARVRRPQRSSPPSSNGES